MNTHTTPQHVCVAALSFELQPAADDKSLQLFPAGPFRSRDGRPKDCPAWLMNSNVAARLIQQINVQQTDVVIDYEHQTLASAENGKPAPAAGWFKSLEWRDGVGVFAIDVDWTAPAAQMIAAKEYRYISPVFTYSSETGEVLQLLHVGLTNFPALDGMQAVALKNLQAAMQHQPPKEETMNPTLKALLASLGLPESTSETDALTAVAALKTKADQLPAKDKEIAALKVASPITAPDPAKFVPIEAVTAMQQQLAALANQVNHNEANGIIVAALKDGRILPAQEEWARNLAQSDLQSLKTFIEKAPPIAALSGTQTGGKPPAGSQGSELTADQIAVCKSLGISQDDFKKSLSTSA